MDKYKISDLAKEFDITTRSIRFYEDVGLIEPERKGNIRVYQRRDKIRLKLILRGKRLGFSLAEIRELFTLLTKTIKKWVPDKLPSSRFVHGDPSDRPESLLKVQKLQDGRE